MTWIVLATCAAFAAPVAYLAARRRGVARRLTVTAPGIEERRYVRIGGVDQWIQIRGADRSNPVVLFLHGHGVSMVPLTPLYRLWEKHFTVVQWDRRMVGRTLIANGRGGNADWTFDQFAADGIELAEHLRQHLQQDKVILVGHSQGTAICARMARRRPELFHAYVGIGQMVDMARNETLAYEKLLQLARKQVNRRAVAGLTKLGSPPYPDPGTWIRKQRWAMALDPEVRAWQKRIFACTLTMPGFTPRDILHSMLDVMLLPQRLYDETMAVTPEWLGTRFEVPVLLLHGNNDLFAMPELVQEYLDAIEAPAKALVWLPGHGHLAPFLAADRVGAELAAGIRQLTGSR